MGVGQSKFGKRTDASFREIAFEAARAAFEDSRLTKNDIDFTVVANAMGDTLIGQSVPGNVVTDYLGLTPKGSIRVEAACATGSAAVLTAYSMIVSGLARTILIVGVEKMNEAGTAKATESMARASDVQWEFLPYGVTFAGFYAMMARAHMAKYGTTETDLARIAIKNHKYGALNQYAHVQKEIALEDVLKSRVIASPLKLYDCSLITDGAAAVILTSAENAKKSNDTPVWLVGLGFATEESYFPNKPEMTGIRGVREAAKQAYGAAKIGPRDLDVAVVHDCFTIAELLAYEDLGLCGKGEGAKLVKEGQTEIGGVIPVNLDGGLKAKGHPIGATGVSMSVEIVKQLRGECGKRQAPKAEVGLTHNVGNTGQYCFVNVYSR